MMTKKDAETYIMNWKNISDFFSESTLTKALKNANLTDYTKKENVPAESDVNYFYRGKGFTLVSPTPQMQTITEYAYLKGQEWERRVTKPCLTWIVPSQYQLKEAQLIREALLIEYPYLDKYSFSVYHFDSTANRKVIDEKRKAPLNKSFYGMEIYLTFFNGEHNQTLYVPLIALKEKDPSIVISRHTKYHEEYYRGPERKEYLDKSLSILELPQVKEFLEDVHLTKKKFKLPVTWEACGIVEIEASNIEEAISIFDANSDMIPLPKESEYVDASFDLSCREISYLELFQD